MIRLKLRIAALAGALLTVGAAAVSPADAGCITCHNYQCIAVERSGALDCSSGYGFWTGRYCNLSGSCQGSGGGGSDPFVRAPQSTRLLEPGQRQVIRLGLFARENSLEARWALPAGPFAVLEERGFFASGGCGASTGTHL
jgi:uncharacterized membrane protein